MPFSITNYVLPILNVKRNNPDDVAADMRAVLRVLYPTIAAKVSYRREHPRWRDCFEVRFESQDIALREEVEAILRPMAARFDPQYGFYMMVLVNR